MKLHCLSLNLPLAPPHLKKKNTVEIRFRTTLEHVEGLSDCAAAVLAWGGKKTNSMGGATQVTSKGNKTTGWESSGFAGDIRKCEVALSLTSPSQHQVAEAWVAAALDSFEEWRRVGGGSPLNGVVGPLKTSVATLGFKPSLQGVETKVGISDPPLLVSKALSSSLEVPSYPVASESSKTLYEQDGEYGDHQYESVDTSSSKSVGEDDTSIVADFGGDKGENWTYKGATSKLTMLTLHNRLTSFMFNKRS
jgi:hypothetical protein